MGIRLYLALAGLMGLVGFIAWLWFGWAALEKKYDALTETTGQILFAIRNASHNPELKLQNAAGQVVALGVAHERVKIELERQNMTIDEMAREAVRLRARAAELKDIAERAQAQRSAALEQLSDMTITPGTRDDCLTLLREAEDALDLVREAGL